MGAIIVHHRHFPEVTRTIGAILASGVEPTSLVVVDNSDDERLAADLRRGVPTGVLLQFVPNRGYAAAVNAGRSALSAADPSIIVVATHEVMPEAGALLILVDAVRNDATIGAAGPTLLLPTDEGDTERVWSLGGRLSPVLGWPQHVRSEPNGAAPAPRDWLDGALCVYPAKALAELMREDFFMYVEELEFHRRLRALGWNVVWVPSARAVQDTEGTPPYLQARNLQLFYTSWGSMAQRLLSVPALIIRQGLIRLLRRQQPIPATRAALLGWWGAWFHDTDLRDSAHGPGSHRESFRRY
ncbi:glycosyltransferase family 2 protein [Nocardioides sp. Soil805]|uniref:glycosyltransferase family 2 protein n=1 Tax=Nocardioides sp. Soil805 TaxID=1736416 RepID=UPI00138F373E|nr:glycosyltransferase family 2 protein [Nocardioides sp. Soil805]